MTSVRRRGLSLALVLASVAALGAVSSTSVVADTGDQKRQADQQVAAAQDALEGTSAALVKAYEAYQATAARVPAAQRALDSARALEQTASRRNDEVAARLAVAQANEARAVQQVTDNAILLQQTQDALDGFAADVFQGGGETQLSVAMGATSPDDFASRLILADTVTSLTSSAITNLQNARAEDTAQKAYLMAVRAEIVKLKTEAEGALATASRAREGAQTSKALLDALVRQRSAQANALEAQKKAAETVVAQAEAEQGRLQALLVAQAARARAAAAAAAARARVSGQVYTPVTGGSGFLNYPANAPITSEYGLRFHPILHVWKLHSGTDFGVPCGTPVFAAADGTVLSAGWGGGDGNRIVIDHGIVSGVDLASTYNHLTSFVVQGGHVSRGQLIAYSGTTGYSTGCHLHFETLENGAFVNPRKWI